MAYYNPDTRRWEDSPPDTGGGAPPVSAPAPNLGLPSYETAPNLGLPVSYPEEPPGGTPSPFPYEEPLEIWRQRRAAPWAPPTYETGAERKIGDISQLAPRIPAYDVPRLDAEFKGPDLSRFAPSTQFQPEFVRPYSEAAYEPYGRLPSAERYNEFTVPLVRAAQAAEEKIPPEVRSAFEKAGEAAQAGSEAAGGMGSVAARHIAGDFDVTRRQEQREKESGVIEGLRRAYHEESVPFVTGAVQAVTDPRYLLLAPQAVARSTIGSGIQAGRAIEPAALRAADVVAEKAGSRLLPAPMGAGAIGAETGVAIRNRQFQPGEIATWYAGQLGKTPTGRAIRRFVSDETGSLNLGGREVPRRDAMETARTFEAELDAMPVVQELRRNLGEEGAAHFLRTSAALTSEVLTAALRAVQVEPDLEAVIEAVKLQEVVDEIRKADAEQFPGGTQGELEGMPSKPAAGEPVSAGARGMGMDEAQYQQYLKDEKASGKPYSLSEPWEHTAAEWDEYLSDVGQPWEGRYTEFQKWHKEKVLDAAERNRGVPEKVLAEYGLTTEDASDLAFNFERMRKAELSSEAYVKQRNVILNREAVPEAGDVLKPAWPPEVPSPPKRPDTRPDVPPPSKATIVKDRFGYYVQGDTSGKHFANMEAAQVYRDQQALAPQQEADQPNPTQAVRFRSRAADAEAAQQVLSGAPTLGEIRQVAVSLGVSLPTNWERRPQGVIERIRQQAAAVRLASQSATIEQEAPNGGLSTTERPGIGGAGGGVASGAGPQGLAGDEPVGAASLVPGSGSQNQATGGGLQQDAIREAPSVGVGDQRGNLGSGARLEEAALLELTSGNPAARGQDHVVRPDELRHDASPVVRFETNLESVRIIKRLEAEGNRLATPEERQTLARFSGWGDSAFSAAFPVEGPPTGTDAWARRGQALADLLGESEYNAIRTSRRTAFFTSPEIVTSVWDALRAMGLDGFHTINWLEPAAGSGRFVGLQPQDLATKSIRTAVELEPITGGILRALYPNTNVYASTSTLKLGFERAPIPDDSIDVAASNIPFGRERISDPAYRGAGRALVLKSGIHNYFISKTLDKLKPGGVLAFVTTHGTLDAPSSLAVRKLFAERADLLGAVRLPKGAFPDTEVVTDIIFMRKRLPTDKPGTYAWVYSQKERVPYSYKKKNYYGEEVVENSRQEVSINRYFLDNPEMVLGVHDAQGTMYAAGEYNVSFRPGETAADMPRLLKNAVDLLPKGVLVPSEAPPSLGEQIQTYANIREGAFVVRDGVLVVKQDGLLKPGPAGDDAIRVKMMLAVRDAARDVVDLQRTRGTPGAIEQAQKDLNRVYDAFTKKYGALNSQKNRILMKLDPDGPFLRSLEQWSGALRKADMSKDGKVRVGMEARAGKLKMPIFNQITLNGAPEAVAVSPSDALALSLNQTGALDFDLMGRALGQTPAEVRTELSRQNLIFHNPAGGWEQAEQYLMGNVREKLKAAEIAATQNIAYRRNIEALKVVQPDDLGASQIKVNMGSAWLPPADLNDFLSSVFELVPGAYYEFVPVAGKWSPRASMRPSHAMREQWGTRGILPGSPGMSAEHLVETILGNRTIDISYTYDKVTYHDTAATKVAQDKAKQLADAFEKWVWADPVRGDRLATLYNDNINALVSRSADGSHLTFPGMTKEWVAQVRPHQKDAVWRMVQDGGGMAAHEVGFGKTLVLAATAMELRRMGLSPKNIIVVPKATHAQFQRQFRQLYPHANILFPEATDFEMVNRQVFLNRIATGDWDAVLLSEEQMGAIPLRPETQAAFLQEQVQEYREALIAEIEATGGTPGKARRGSTQKQLEEHIANMEAALHDLQEKISARSDEGKVLYWDDLGVSTIMVDEAHHYKAVRWPTSRIRVRGIPQRQSLRGWDLYMKARITQRSRGGRGVIFATGTPIANTIAELYTMMRYLQEPDLEKMGLKHFDSWASTFGVIEDAMEFNMTGGAQMVERFRKFVNTPELSRLWQQYTDVRVVADTPEMAKYLPQTRTTQIIAPASPEQIQFTKDLRARKEALKGKGQPGPGEDNMLLIGTHARMAGIDLRLVSDPKHIVFKKTYPFAHLPENPNSKINLAAQAIYKRWVEMRADKGTQIVFLDMGTPKDADVAAARKQRVDDPEASIDIDTVEEQHASQTLYAELTKKLVQLGMPRKEIVWIHEANTDIRKIALSDAVNAGDQSVLIGSRGKAGVGINVQERGGVIHDLDIPYRPDELIQGHGRFVRPGNKIYGPVLDDQGNVVSPGRGVEIIQYITPESGDTFMLNGVVQKAKGINVMMKRNVTARELDDVDANVADWAVALAESTGNPDAVRLMELQPQLTTLHILEGAHKDEIQRARHQVAILPDRIAGQKKEIIRLQEDAALASAKGDFAINIGGKSFDKRPEAGEALKEAITAAAIVEKGIGKEIARFKGFSLSVTHSPRFTGTSTHDAYFVEIRNPSHPGAAAYSVTVQAGELSSGVVQRVVNAVEGIPGRVMQAQESLRVMERDLVDYGKRVNEPFKRQGEVRAMESEVSRLEENLKNVDNPDYVKPEPIELTVGTAEVAVAPEPSPRYQPQDTSMFPVVDEPIPSPAGEVRQAPGPSTPATTAPRVGDVVYAKWEPVATTPEATAAAIEPVLRQPRAKKEAVKEAGLPPNEPPRIPPEQPPTSLGAEDVPPDELERGATLRMRATAGLVSDPARVMLDENIQTYEQLGNKVAHSAAAANIANDPAGVRARVLDLNREPNPIGIAENIQLMQQADAAGDLEEFMAMAVALAQKGTVRGQEIQLFSTIGRVSPEGIMHEVVKTIRAYTAAHDGKITPALEKRLRAAEEKAIRLGAEKQAHEEIMVGALTHMEELRAAKEAAEDKIDQLMGIAPGRVRVSRFMDRMQDFFADERGEARINPFVKPEVTLDEVAWQKRAEKVKAIPDPAERKAAYLKFMEDLTSEAQKAGVPRHHGRTMEEPLQVVAALEGPGHTAYEQRLKQRLTDDRAREVAPRVRLASRDAANEVVDLFKRAGKEMDTDQADSFIVEARELDDLDPEERRQGIIDLVEFTRRSLVTARNAPHFEVTDKWLETQAGRIETLDVPAARQAYARLHTTESLAWGRMQELGRRTGVSIDGEAFAAQAAYLRNLRDRPLDEQLAAVDDLVNYFKEQEPLKTALAQRKALRDRDAAERRQARQVTNNLKRMTTQRAEKATGVTDAQQRGIAAVVRVLDQAETRLTETEAREINRLVADLNGLSGEALTAGISGLKEYVAHLEPVAQALAATTARKAEIARLKLHAKRLGVLMGEIIPEAKKRTRNRANEIFNLAQRVVVNNELRLGRQWTEDFLERGRLAQALGPGKQQDRMYKALMLDIKNLLPPSRWKAALELTNIPQATQTMWDFSYPMRQGSRLAMAHPREWARLWAPMFKAMRDPKRAAEMMNELATRPMANIAEWSGLDFVEFGQPMMVGEEHFGNTLMGRVPGYQGSERGFVLPGNMQRARLFDNFVRAWFKPGTDFGAFKTMEEALAATNGKTLSDFKNAAAMYNTLSGRGNITWLKQSRPVIGRLVYATRWSVSQFEPYGMMLNPKPSAVPLAVRAELAKNLVSIYGGMAGIITLGVLTGVWDSEGDPRSANFGKVRFKGSNTWIDLTFGAGPIIRFIARIYGQRSDGTWGGVTKTSSGEYVPYELGSNIYQFARSKAAPLPGSVSDFIHGSAPGGQRRDVTKLEDWVDALWHMIGPLSWHDIADGAWEAGLKDGVLNVGELSETAIAATSLAGVGVQSYQTLRDLQNKATVAGDFTDNDGTKLTQYEQLNQGQRRVVNETALVRSEVDRIDLQRRVDTRQEMATRFKVYDEGKAHQEQELHEAIGDNWRRFLGHGKGLADKLRAFKQARFALTSGVLTEEVLAEYHKGKDVKLDDVIANKYWSVALPEDPDTLELDFQGQRREREKVLDEADALGVRRDYITGAGEGTFRGKRFSDPVVRAAVEALEAAQETVRPYWEVKDTAEKEFPDATDRFKARVTALRRKQMRLGDAKIARALADWYGRRDEGFVEEGFAPQPTQPIIPPWERTPISTPTPRPNIIPPWERTPTTAGVR